MTQKNRTSFMHDPQGYLKPFHRYDFLKASSTNKLAYLQRDWYRQAICKQTSLY